MIVICSLRAAPEQVLVSGARKAISILSENAHPHFQTVRGEDHLKLTFNDVAQESPGLIAPGADDMQRLLTFLSNWQSPAPLLIHCWAGISRSTAAGFIATCLHQPQRDERELARELRQASPSATPNPMLVALADKALGRDGRMISAIKNIGRGADAYEGMPFTLHVS
jgi:predicted protein tyrosine phosphatase